MRFMIAAAVLTFAFPTWGADLSGAARIIDGDTLEISGHRIRLYGIDAPEKAQTCRTPKGHEQRCGDLARQALVALTENQTVTCQGKYNDRYARLVAVCRVGWMDIGEQMVLDGWALAYRKYSQDYVRAETVAKARREGLWRTEFVAPWEWRKGGR